MNCGFPEEIGKRRRNIEHIILAGLYARYIETELGIAEESKLNGAKRG